MDPITLSKIDSAQSTIENLLSTKATQADIEAICASAKKIPSMTIKSVQRGLRTGSPVGTIAINAVNVQKSIILLQSCGSGSESTPIEVRAAFASASQVSIRSAMNGKAIIAWQVIEFY